MPSRVRDGLMMEHHDVMVKAFGGLGAFLGRAMLRRYKASNG